MLSPVVDHVECMGIEVWLEPEEEPGVRIELVKESDETHAGSRVVLVNVYNSRNRAHHLSWKKSEGHKPLNLWCEVFSATPKGFSTSEVKAFMSQSDQSTQERCTRDMIGFLRKPGGKGNVYGFLRLEIKRAEGQILVTKDGESDEEVDIDIVDEHPWLTFQFKFIAGPYRPHHTSTSEDVQPESNFHMHEDVKPLQLSSAATSYKASSSGRRWRGRKRFNFTSRNKQRGDRSVSPCHSATKDTAVETQASDGFITIKTKREFIEQTLDESVAGPSRIPVDAVPKLSERAWSPNSIEIIRASSRSQVASRPIQFDFVKNQSPGVSEDPPLPRYSTRSRDGNGDSSTANDTLVIEGPERRGQKRKAPSSSHVSPVEQKFETPEVVLEASASQDARVSVSEPMANAPADLPSSLTASTVAGPSGELSRPESSACPPDPVYPSLEVRPVPNLHVPSPSRVSREADPSDSVPPFTLPQRPCLLAPSASSEILMPVTNDCEQKDVVSDVTMQPPLPEKMLSEHGGCEKPTADSAGLAQPSLHSPGSTPAGITPLSSISARVPVSAGSRASSSALSAQSIQERVDKAKMEIEEYRRKRRRLLSDAEALEDELAAEQEHIALLEELKRERKALRNDEQLVRAKQRQLEELRQQREVLEMDTD